MDSSALFVEEFTSEGLKGIEEDDDSDQDIHVTQAAHARL